MSCCALIGEATSTTITSALAPDALCPSRVPGCRAITWCRVTSLNGSVVSRNEVKIQVYREAQFNRIRELRGEYRPFK